jgi:RIO kinase 1
LRFHAAGAQPAAFLIQTAVDGFRFEKNESLMEKSRNIKYYTELDDEGAFDWPGKTQRRPPKQSNAAQVHAARNFVDGQDDSRNTFAFTYQAARFEEGWLLDSLGYFYEQHWISDVLRKIKAGKEASVYLCRAGALVDEPLVAAKVYRPRMLRNLRDDHVYREGRVDLDEDGRELHDDGAIHAISVRTRYGEEMRHQSWIAYEYTALQSLFAAGVEVPRPYAMAHNAILMHYLGDTTFPAPTLNTVNLPRIEAESLFHRVMENLDRMLADERIHGDLSAYNILYWEGEMALIDFPQVVSPIHNRNAYRIFERDVTRLCEYFTDQGLALHPSRLAADLWAAHGYHARPEVHPGLLDANDPGDRRVWKQTQKSQK